MLRHHWFTKPLLALVLTTAACQQKTKQRDPVAPPPPEVRTDREAFLVEIGESSQAAFSPDGKKMLFVSRGRPGHAQGQVYEKDLQSGAETRITFQNGDTTHPEYHPRDAYIVYASSTDELKENPPFAKPTPASVLPPAFQEPSEVYIHALNSLEISRATHHPGYDGDPSFMPDGSLIWTRVRGERLETLLMTRAQQIRPLKGLGTNPAHYTVSADGKWKAWVDWDQAYGVAKLKLQNANKAAVELLPDQVMPKMDLAFTPDSKYLMWSQLDGTNYRLFIADVATNCARRLEPSTDDADRRFPKLAPDGKRLVYTVQRKARSRIAQRGFTPPTGPCVGAP